MFEKSYRVIQYESRDMDTPIWIAQVKYWYSSTWTCIQITGDHHEETLLHILKNPKFMSLYKCNDKNRAIKSLRYYINRHELNKKKVEANIMMIQDLTKDDIINQK